MDTDILIVGAGPVGLALAVDLHRRGVGVRIVDKVSSGENYSRAMVVHTRQQEQLAIAGVMTRMVPHGHPMRPTRVHSMGKYVGTLDLSGLDSPFPAPWMIYQSEVEAQLEASLNEAGIHVERLVEFETLEQRKESVLARLRGPDGEEWTIESRWLVGCDGAKSAVRAATGIAYRGQRYQEDIFQLGDVTLDSDLPPHTGGVWLGRKGSLVIIVPMQDHHRVIVTYPADVQPLADGDDVAYGYDKTTLTLDELEDLTCKFGPKVKLSNPRWLARYGVEARLAQQYRVGRVLLAGDAAHIQMPLAGQWMNVGLGDAFNLGWKLALAVQGLAGEVLVDSYSAERLPVAMGLSMANDKLWDRTTKPPLWYRIGSPIVGPYVFPRDKVQNRLRNNISQLSVGYPRSPIVTDRRTWPGGPSAGERAPDAPISLGAGSVHGLLAEDPRSLLLLLAGPSVVGVRNALDVAARVGEEFDGLLRAVVVSSSESGVSGDSAGTVYMHADAALYKKYGTSENAGFLLRPDSHIGYAGPIDLQLIRDHLLVLTGELSRATEQSGGDDDSRRPDWTDTGHI